MTRAEVGDLLARIDLAGLVREEVTLTEEGRSLRGTCPGCGEQSFHVIPKARVYHCFGCGQGGDAIGWVRWRRGVDFAAAVDLLVTR